MDVKTPALSIGFITALVSPELVGCADVLESSGWSGLSVPPSLRSASIRRWGKSIAGVEVHAFTGVIGEMGQTASALETMAFLSRTNTGNSLDIVFLCGIAGSLVDWIKKRDVIIGTDVQWILQNRISDGHVCDADGRTCDVYEEIRPPVSRYDPEAGNFLAAFVEDKYPPNRRYKDYEVVAGSIFTWDYVVNGDRQVKRINLSCKGTLCVEMEAAGFLRAVQRFNHLNPTLGIIPYIVRGISDDARNKDYNPADREFASRNAVSVAVALAEAKINDMIKK